MNFNVGPSRFVAAVCAVAISTVIAWAFVQSTASSERDPFQIAKLMRA